MIYATEEDKDGCRLLYTTDGHHEVGEFNHDGICGSEHPPIVVFYARPEMPFTIGLLEAVLNMQKVLQP